MNNSKRLIFIATNCLGLLGWISMNIYLPSIPALEQYFHARPDDLRFSISIFLLGFSLSQFFWGSISERLGRIKPILCGLCLAECGTLLALFSQNILMFDTARFIEGAGIGAAAVLTRAVLADSFSKIELSRAFSFISTTANIMPALAPIVGGYLLLVGGWRTIFAFLALYTTFLIYLFSKYVGETHPAIKSNFRVSHALKQYFEAFTHLSFLGYLLPYAIVSGGLIGFYAATPFIFIAVLHMAPQHYGFLAIFTVLTYILGANFSSKLAKRIGFDRAILLGICMTLLSGIILFGCWLLLSLNGLTVMIPMMTYAFGGGLIAPNANASAMGKLSHMSGPAGAVMGSVVYGCSAVLSAILTSLNLASLISIAGYVTVIALIALVSFYGLIYKNRARA